MKDVRFITRADDAGSSLSANAAIARVIRAGFIKNVSVMAPGAFLSDAAERLCCNKKVCFGMHATINAEWDHVKWGPVSDIGKQSGLADENGFFLPDPALFEKTAPRVETILREYDAQLDALTRAGFDIRYVDSHMLPERFVPGLDEAVADWAKRHGLIDHMYFYRLPEGFLETAKEPKQLFKALINIPNGQYFFLIHPALYGEEMLRTGNAQVTGEEVARSRNGEAKLFSSRLTGLSLRTLGIRPIRYDEAEQRERVKLSDLPF